MGEANFLFYNGKIQKTGKPLIYPDNRSFRYGDGFFETIKYMNGKILLSDLHFERLFSTLDILHFQRPNYFTKEYFTEQISLIAKKNMHHKLARVRVTIFRGESGLYDAENHFPHHLIQTWDLNPANNKLNENGLVIDVFKDAKKSCDKFSSLKSNNFLSYAMAAIWVKEQRLNDALLLNAYDRVADATIANLFIVKDGVIKTPALTEGPVNGVMRKHLMHSIKEANLPFDETGITLDDLSEASEIFLTNAIYGIRWVKQFRENGYVNKTSSFLHKNFLTPLFV
jgi:branched-chain amino acid aminotransferase